MASLRAFIMGFVSLILSLLILTQPSEQQYAWRPQGRFGKRESYLTRAVMAEPSLDVTSKIKMLDTAMFESNGVLCVSAGSKGLYRCFTMNPSPGAPTPVSMASTPFIEVGDVLCVSVADIGAYRCFQLDEREIPEQSLTNH